jgi:NCAIR mutase (PurE)-related protein
MGVRRRTNTSTNSSSSSRTYGILATRVEQSVYDTIIEKYPIIPIAGRLEYCSIGKVLTLVGAASDVVQAPTTAPARKKVIVCTAGTTDLPIAEEAALVLAACDVETVKLYDCGVAGLHRIVSSIPTLTSSEIGCVIVCAGMDGALPSVVAGLVGVPVIAVPTSVGYGASFHGVSAMLTMLNSCAPGVAVVNIDGGFSAAAMAFKIVKGQEGV